MCIRIKTRLSEDNKQYYPSNKEVDYIIMHYDNELIHCNRNPTYRNDIKSLKAKLKYFRDTYRNDTIKIGFYAEHIIDLIEFYTMRIERNLPRGNIGKTWIKPSERAIEKLKPILKTLQTANDKGE